ncbi:MAG: adenine deaminase [Planctomycetota bacterium]
MHPLSPLLATARGDEPATLVLQNARLVNVFTGHVQPPADLALYHDRVAGLGADYTTDHTIDLAGAYVSPGFIDAHVHIESSLCTPAQFAAAVLPRGVTTVIADPHELANVVGIDAVTWMAAASKDLPLNVVLMGPSCVPATPMATAGAALDAQHLQALYQSDTIHGLAEVMNYPGVINGQTEVLAKLDALRGQPIDGHSPGASGKALDAYAAAGVGSDHECVTPDEARDRLERGLYLLIREATNARNLDALLPVVTPQNSRRVCFCTDDRTPGDLLNFGTIDHMVRRAISHHGVDPLDALRMATLNPAEWFGLRDAGAIAPGRTADLLVFEDLDNPTPKMVFAKGKLVAENGKILDGAIPAVSPGLGIPGGRCTVDAANADLAIPATGEKIRVIGHLADQLLTEAHTLEATIQDGHAMADPTRDLLKMAVFERHHNTGNVGLGFIQGIGLQRGAIAGTVAHDHHNLVAIGADDTSIRTAAAAIAEDGGGLAVAHGNEVLARLPLPIGGLMSTQPVQDVADAYAQAVEQAKALGSPLADPFMAMSFMALEVIPSLKLTDLGLVDVERFELVDLFV